MFDLTIVSPKRVIFEEAVERVIVDGNDSEYELMSFHANALGVLRDGNIIINNKISIPIKAGIVSFKENKCLILAEEYDYEEKKSG